MKRILSLTIAALVGLGSVSASEYEFMAKKRRKKKKGGDAAFSQGQNSVHLGAGFVPFLLKPDVATDLEYYGTIESSAKMVFGFRYEAGILEFLSVGPVLGFSSAKVTVIDHSNPDNVNGFDFKYTIIGARAAYHIVGSEKLDLYGGAMFGANLTKVKAFGERNYFDTPGSFSTTWQVFAGANFYIIPNLGLFAELGYKYCLVNTGITFKF